MPRRAACAVDPGNNSARFAQGPKNVIPLHASSVLPNLRWRSAGEHHGQAVPGRIAEGKAQVIEVKTLPQTVAQFRKYGAEISVAGIRRRGEQLAAITKEIVEPITGDVSVALIAALHRLLSSVPSMQS